ncbi:acylphosphatase [Cupriavidus sp. H18C1]|uniref:acylphosphatase n=1 Tax=Cupriavidus sp. H18C1 TaxID=3241601 RepID=UPI003BB91296
METWHMVAHGKVQGVGYRAACEDLAIELGLGGWVRNRNDGTVEVMAYGPPERLAKLREWMEHGPPAAKVERLEVEPGEGEFELFEWRSSE